MLDEAGKAIGHAGDGGACLPHPTPGASRLSMDPHRHGPVRAPPLTDDLIKLAHPEQHGSGVSLQAPAAKTMQEFQRYRFWEWLWWVVGTPKAAKRSNPFRDVTLLFLA
jgi:hypothetical protein